jgi:hypothetical protein
MSDLFKPSLAPPKPTELAPCRHCGAPLPLAPRVETCPYCRQAADYQRAETMLREHEDLEAIKNASKLQNAQEWSAFEKLHARSQNPVGFLMLISGYVAVFVVQWSVADAPARLRDIPAKAVAAVVLTSLFLAAYVMVMRQTRRNHMMRLVAQGHFAVATQGAGTGMGVGGGVDTGEGEVRLRCSRCQGPVWMVRSRIVGRCESCGAECLLPRDQISSRLDRYYEDLMKQRTAIRATMRQAIPALADSTKLVTAYFFAVGGLVGPLLGAALWPFEYGTKGSPSLAMLAAVGAEFSLSFAVAFAGGVRTVWRSSPWLIVIACLSLPLVSVSVSAVVLELVGRALANDGILAYAEALLSRPSMMWSVGGTLTAFVAYFAFSMQMKYIGTPTDWRQ